MRPLIPFLLGGSQRFRRNFLKIASATALAQAVGIACLPALSRLYTPDDFAALATYTLVQSVILSFITGRAEWIVPNAKTRTQARRLIRLGFSITILVLCLTSAGLAVFRAPLIATLKLPPTSKILWLLPLGALAGALQLLYQSWYVFDGNLSRLGYSKVAQVLSTLVLSLVLGLTVLTESGLVLAYVVGFGVAVGVLLPGRGNGVRASLTLNWRTFARLVRAYGRQLISSTALSIVNISMAMSLTLLLVLFYSSQIVGWYGLVFRLATAPIGFFTTAIVQSFWTDAAILAKTDPKALRKFYLESTRRLSYFSVPFAVLFLCGPLYIPAIFGREDWSGAGHLLMALTPYLTGMIVFGPTTHLIVYGKAHWQLACDLLTVVLAALSFALIAQAGHDAWVAVAVTSTILLAGYLLRFAVHLVASSRQESIASPQISSSAGV